MCLEQGSVRSQNKAACWPDPRPPLRVCSPEEKKKGRSGGRFTGEESRVQPDSEAGLVLDSARGVGQVHSAS